MKNQFREKAYEICQRAYEKRLNVPSIQRNIYSNQVVVLCFFFFFLPRIERMDNIHSGKEVEKQDFLHCWC